MTDDKGSHCMPFDEFRAVIARELQIEESRVTREADFVEDLLADSIKLVEMLLRIEELGIAIPLEAAWEVRTVGDAYDVYARHAA